MSQSINLDNLGIVLPRDENDSAEMNVDGSETLKQFVYKVPKKQKFLVHRQTVLLIDRGQFDADIFGGTLNPLTNGVRTFVRRPNGGMASGFPDELNIRVNGDFALLAGVDVQPLGGERGLGVRWTWSKATGGLPVLIPSEYEIVIEIRDDLSRLTRFRSTIQGIFE